MPAAYFLWKRNITFSGVLGNYLKYARSIEEGSGSLVGLKCAPVCCYRNALWSLLLLHIFFGNVNQALQFDVVVELQTQRVDLHCQKY